MNNDFLRTVADIIHTPHIKQNNSFLYLQITVGMDMTLMLYTTMESFEAMAKES